MAPAQHHRSAHFVRQGLFRKLTSFAELEARIAALPDEKQRGDAFEVFVEAYAATHPICQAEEVWPNETAPARVRKELNLPSSDYGADGIYKTRNNELVAYQAKFRTGRKPLTYRELSTFFGLTEKTDQRVLFTNVDDIAVVAEARSRFSATRGHDFDRLEADDFDRICDWLGTGRIRRQERQPRPYQSSALTDINRGLQQNDRATVVMACGTGKTLVALWAVEETQPSSVLVLVPSLALVKQTLLEWAKWNSWGERFRHLCVCSDPTVSSGVDEITIEQADANFKVSTDASEVDRCLNQSGECRSGRILDLSVGTGCCGCRPITSELRPFKGTVTMREDRPAGSNVYFMLNIRGLFDIL